MMWNKLKYMALAVLLTVGLTGFGIGQWVAASNGAKEGQPIEPKEQGSATSVSKAREPARTDEIHPAPNGRRREAVIRLPLGTFVKEVDAAKAIG
jgi:hypothetical protein